jgi:glucose-6-phosphate 1-dehydrogenase
MAKKIKPTTIVIFGASGDLTQRKLIPALYNNFRKDRLPDPIHVVGFARSDYNDETFRERLHSGVQKYSSNTYTQAIWEEFLPSLHYIRGDLSKLDDYSRLDKGLDELERGPANRLYYLATGPNFFVPTVANLGLSGMATQSDGWRNIVIEKPFGRDLHSAQELNKAVHEVFDESQIYRIDHYLGKETAQNILFLRFANAIFEPIWNRRYIDNIQITVAEKVDVGHRADFYDTAGVVRDMFQNHILQLLSLVAMEPPASFQADAVRNEKVQVLSAIRPIDLADTVRAQYNGYCQADGVSPHSQTPTFAATKLYIDNWRWKDVPFYLRSGKSLKKKSSEIILEFQSPPHLMFDLPQDYKFTPNILSICIQPDEGIHLKFQAKVPDSDQDMESVNMEFHYHSSFGGNKLPDAYERLLLNAIESDASLFARSDGIEAAWRLIDPVLDGWKNTNQPPLVTYKSESWGPSEADLLLTRDSREWHYGCLDHVS